MSQGDRLTAGAAAAVLVLTLATGVLHSPFLLLLPVPLLLLLHRLAPAWGAATMVLAGTALAVGEALVENLAWWEAGVLTLGLVVPAATAGRVRAWLRAGTLAQRVGLRLPESGAEPAAQAELDQLRVQLEEVRRWAAADAVLLWESTGEQARAVAAAGRSLPPMLSLQGDPLGWVAREGTPARLERTPHWADRGVEVMAARLQPAADGGGTWLVTCEYRQGRGSRAPDELVRYLAPLGSQLLALGALREAAALQQRLNSLLALLQRIPVEIELSGFGRELLEAALAFTGGTGGCVGTWTEDEGRVFARVGDDGGPLPGAPFTAPTSELALAVRAGTPLVREPGRWKPGDTQVANQEDEWLTRPHVVAAIPLLTRSGPVGAMALWSSRSGSLDLRALGLLGAVVPFAALHLDHVVAYGQLRERAERDPLTGLRNRRSFESDFLAERLRFERYGRPLALLMLDIDHFKAINDTHGHQTGDEVLRRLAQVVVSTIRDVDIPARLGGEEFAVLLPETTLDAAVEVAERIRAAAERAGFDAGGGTIEVRVSLGVSACPELVPAPQSLIATADAALYQAKRDGRNLVRLAPASTRRT